MTTTSAPAMPTSRVPTWSGTSASWFLAASPSEPRPAKSSVLVIDDANAVRELLSLYLQKEGLEVATACSAAEGRVLVERGQFDLVILNWKLNGAEGVDLLRLSKTKHPAIPVIIFIGADQDEGCVSRGHAGQADAVVRKLQPFDALSAVIFRLLDQRRVQPLSAA